MKRCDSSHGSIASLTERESEDYYSDRGPRAWGSGEPSQVPMVHPAGQGLHGRPTARHEARDRSDMMRRREGSPLAQFHDEVRWSVREYQYGRRPPFTLLALRAARHTRRSDSAQNLCLSQSPVSAPPAITRLQHVVYYCNQFLKPSLAVKDGEECRKEKRDATHFEVSGTCQPHEGIVDLCSLSVRTTIGETFLPRRSASCYPPL